MSCFQNLCVALFLNILAEKIFSHPAEMLCSSAPELMSTRKKFYLTVQVYPVGVECLTLKTRKQNLEMLRLLNFEILKTVLLI